MENNHKIENQKFVKTLENPEEIEKYFADQAKFLSTKQKIERIEDFNDDFDFLNNEFECPVWFEDLEYPNAYNAYQAARTDLEIFRKRFQANLSAYDLYDLARQINNPVGWEQNKLLVMEKIVRDKFVRNGEIKQKLVETGSRELVNSFKDKTAVNLYWGVVAQEGENQLGKILMNVRKSIGEATDVPQWLNMCFNFPKEVQMCPVFKISVLKEQQPIEQITFSKKPFYFCGNSEKCDLKMAHPTISRMHFVFGFDQKNGVLVVDLASKNGTFVNEHKLSAFNVFRVKQSTFSVKCGSSTREYKFEVDFGFVKKYLDRKKRQLEFEAEKCDGEKTEEQKKLFVSGVKSVPKSRELENLFESFGEIKDLKIVDTSKNGGETWIAFVRFYKSESLRRVLKQPGIYLKNEKLVVKKAVNKF